MKADEGYFFGLGFFETIAVEKGTPIFLKEHLERLKASCDFLGISFSYDEKEVKEILQEKGCPSRGVLKIVVSAENTLFFTRENHYEPADYEKGFSLAYSRVRRNETSPLTYHKSLNYGDCILEKRAVAGTEIQERIFLNTQGAISEGCTTNLFFTKGDELITPEESSGLLPGIVRAWIIGEAGRRGEPIQIRRIFPEETETFDGCFVTNSLLGIMPVRRLENRSFSENRLVRCWMERYQEVIKSLTAA
jgi:4-amino-4-deoxychorismate lyase